MKIHSKRPPANRGSTLTVTLLTCTILGGLLAAYLSLIGTQQTLVCRSHNWNQAIVVAEGGMEDQVCPCERQAPRGLGEDHVITDHHADRT